MVVKYTKNFLDKLENLFASSSYHLRYEKGNFKSGYCLLKETKVVIITINTFLWKERSMH